MKALNEEHCTQKPIKISLLLWWK